MIADNNNTNGIITVLLAAILGVCGKDITEFYGEKHERQIWGAIPIHSFDLDISRGNCFELWTSMEMGLIF